MNPVVSELTIYLRAWLFAIQDMHEAALRDIEYLSETEMTHPYLFYVKGWSLCKINQVESAFLTASRLIEKLPESDLGYWLRAQVFARIGKVDDAFKALETGFELNKFSCICRSAMAEVYYEKGEYEKAIEISDQALSLNKYCFNAARIKSLCYVALNEIPEAEKWSEHADEIYCNDGFSWYCYGVISTAKKDYESALSNFSRAIDLYAYNPKYYLERSKVYEKLGKSEEAKDDIRKSDEIQSFIDSQAAAIAQSIK